MHKNSDSLAWSNLKQLKRKREGEWVEKVKLPIRYPPHHNLLTHPPYASIITIRECVRVFSVFCLDPGYTAKKLVIGRKYSKTIYRIHYPVDNICAFTIWLDIWARSAGNWAARPASRKKLTSKAGHKNHRQKHCLQVEEKYDQLFRLSVHNRVTEQPTW